jgi:flagellar hook-associated protein 3 FlgL
LENNVTADINTVIGTLDDALSQVITDSSELGALQNRLSLTEEMIANENINFASALSKTQDTDVAEAIVNHNALEYAMTASLRTMSEAIQTSLVDFVG